MTHEAPADDGHETNPAEHKTLPQKLKTEYQEFIAKMMQKPGEQNTIIALSIVSNELVRDGYAACLEEAGLVIQGILGDLPSTT